MFGIFHDKRISSFRSWSFLACLENLLLSDYEIESHNFTEKARELRSLYYKLNSTTRFIPSYNKNKTKNNKKNNIRKYKKVLLWLNSAHTRLYKYALSNRKDIERLLQQYLAEIIDQRDSLQQELSSTPKNEQKSKQKSKLSSLNTPSLREIKAAFISAWIWIVKF